MTILRASKGEGANMSKFQHVLSFSVWPILLMFAASCGQDGTIVSNPAPAASDETANTWSQPMLPAHPLPGERNGSKGDQFDDYRLANTNTFGITSAPKTPMRAVGQFEDHQSLLLAWTGAFPETYAGIVSGSNPVIDVYVLHEGEASKQQFQQAMANNGVGTTGINYVNTDIDSIWMRDYGPLSVRSPAGEVAFVDPRYYHQRVFDDAIPTLMGNSFGINVYRQPLSWEGGT
ncbi:MAG: hypothetical protein ACI9OJ_005583, partial [Myxococcota bacterium]